MYIVIVQKLETGTEMHLACKHKVKIMHRKPGRKISMYKWDIEW